MPLNESLIHGLVVKFASIISPIRSGKAAEREAKEGLNEVWPELFGDAPGMVVRGNTPDGRPLTPILLMAHKYYVDTNMALVPSLILFPEGLEIHIHLKLGG